MSDALLAAELLATAPSRLGGIWLRGPSAEREAVLAYLTEAFADRPVRRLPVHIDEERLCGGIDVASSLSAGRRIEQAGLLQEVAGGLLVVPMAERLGAMVAGRIAQAMDAGAGFALVLIDDGGEEEVPPVSLTERVAFWCDFSAELEKAQSTSPPEFPSEVEGPRANGSAQVPRLRSGQTEVGLGLAQGDRQTLANITLALGIDSARAMLFAQSALALSSQIEDRDTVTDDDIQFVARTVLGPRATRIPQQAEEPPPPPPPEGEEEPPPGDNDGEDQQHDPDQLDDLILAAVLASIPKDVLARIGEGRSARRSTGAGG
ncbi:MAG: magnesium chelatase, partial [Blastomonas sp.]|nr:magnesium chelatase [Blastomonas sp.]